MRALRWLLVAGACLGAGGCGAGEAGVGTDPSEGAQPLIKPRAVGLSLHFENGQASPLTLIGEGPRYVQEIDLVEAVPSAADDGITPLIAASAFSTLDWSGATQVEEQWVPNLDGTFTRERYFRGAKWMREASSFKVAGIDAAGHEVGAPISVQAGRDDQQRPRDDAFVRRFVARQTAFGCVAIGDCGAASYLAEALVQLRDALDATGQARRIHARAVALRLVWSQLPAAPFQVPVTQQPEDRDALAYGFSVSLEPVGLPANRRYYVPGEAVSLRVTFRDGRGTRLHPRGQLPSYGEFASGRVTSGLRYLDVQLRSRLYYALKHRESNLLAVLSGPTNALETPVTIVDPNAFFGPQVPFATRAVDGYTAIGQTIPPAAIIFGGFADPALWATPVSDVLTFTLPADAAPGTYVAAIKARREYAGEALNRGATFDVQVGQTRPSHFTARTRCGACHTESKQTSFDRILHGIDDKRACFGCHSSLGIELDNAIDIRVHTIHDRSERFPGDVGKCTTCHLSRPNGPARGLLP